jgi:hypothetical protein
MTKVHPFDVWLCQALRLTGRSRSEAVRTLANMQTDFWRDRWHEGLSPRATVDRLRIQWS